MFIASYKGHHCCVREHIESSTPEEAAMIIALKAYNLNQPSLVTGLFRGIKVRPLGSKKKSAVYTVGVNSAGQQKVLPT
ncbi:hypothetical protein ABER99_20320 [Paenibacillus glucanolyticus]|jgi:hypothetical protein|uniref:Uncharacterized protein n=1 Tax=Paenibacillus glucanolyticus TaxID=59843 RepID=A0A163GJ57_9BACL|nr:hypothetical protein [Paenibacillus glucanolyticus]KZS45002.1 hypothetical protein AWU65_03205 [Paenibacillus glucanolyticus]OMF64141.1 hypothetical protein BK142_32125 [Paenibacillus glucanolyticus]